MSNEFSLKYANVCFGLFLIHRINTERTHNRQRIITKAPYNV